jgi:putative ABC transport system permease protein
VGVAPAGLRFFRSRADLYVPVGLWGNQDAWRDRGNHQGLTVLARLQPAASLESSRVEMDTIARRLEAQYPRTNSGQSVLLQPLFETQISDVRPSLVMLVACVGLVLLITCANVANLLLSRAPARQREIALRAALGAGRRRIVRQLLTESVLLAGIGGTLGVLVASWGIEALLRIAPANIPRLDTTRLDAGVLAFTLGLSVLTGLVFGIAPALQASRADLNEGLKAGARGGTVTPAGRRLQTGLLVSEIALALAVVTGAGLMVRSILAVHDVELGFQTAKVLAVDLALPDAKYATRERRRAFFEQSLERIRALPGVQSASGVMCPPLYGSCWNSVYLAEGQAVPSQAELPVSAFNVVDPDYFKTLRVPLLEGRWFTRTDGASPVVIVNATLARRHWPGESPLGKRIKQGFPQDKTPWREIVGVVADTRQMGAEWQPGPEVYCPLSQEIDSTLTLVVRSSGDPLLQVGAVAAAIHGLDPEQPVDNIRPMTRDQAESTARRRFSTLLLGLFGALALVLAAVGIYGVNSCSVASRMHEIGVRFALGARRIDVVRLVLRRGMKPALAGVVAGLAGVTAFARLMSGLIYGVTPTDPLTVASTAGLLIVVALAACWLPALRAARIDPMIVLRLE